MRLFLILFALCLVTTTGLMSLEDQIAETQRPYCDGPSDYVPRPGYVPNNKYPLHLALNYNKGTYLVFSDDRTYEIAPDDRIYSSYWVTPFPPQFSDSDDSDYPILITNPWSDRSVRAKEVSTREILREEMEPTPVTPPTPIPTPTPTPQPEETPKK